MTLLTSWVAIVRFRLETATTPREFCPLTCWPLTPTMTSVTSYPAISSASSMAFTTDAMVLSMLTMTPFFIPFEGVTPTPMTSTWPFAFMVPITAQVFVVPISRPTRISSILRSSFHLTITALPVRFISSGYRSFRSQ